jgi:hypothetical protein
MVWASMPHALATSFQNSSLFIAWGLKFYEMLILLILRSKINKIGVSKMLRGCV